MHVAPLAHPDSTSGKDKIINRLVWPFAFVTIIFLACEIDTDSLPSFGRTSTPSPNSGGNATLPQEPNRNSTLSKLPTPTSAPAVTLTINQTATPEESEVQERIAMLQEASETLAALADAPPPSGLGELEAREFTAYSTWLKRSSEKLEARVKETKAARKLMESTKEMQEMNQSFNLQYLSLQQNMQAENRQFTMVSNLMKKNHAAAREAINNVR